MYLAIKDDKNIVSHGKGLIFMIIIFLHGTPIISMVNICIFDSNFGWKVSLFFG